MTTKTQEATMTTRTDTSKPGPPTLAEEIGQARAKPFRNNPTLESEKDAMKAAIVSLRGKLQDLDPEIETIERCRAAIEAECVRLGSRNSIAGECAAASEALAPEGTSAATLHKLSQLIRWRDSP